MKHLLTALRGLSIRTRMLGAVAMVLAMFAGEAIELLKSYARTSAPVLGKIQGGAYDSARVADRMLRSLAQRSAGAAREIKALIVASVQRVSAIVGEISIASAEQSTGIAQVNSAVSNLDHMTQQNAVLVEESAAAAESLNAQAAHLGGLVGTFKLQAA